MDDAGLLEAIHRGDEGAFEAFVERYGRRLLAFGKRMCNHAEDGEDVFQETLLAAYRGLAELRDPGALRTWLFRVAANACRMRRRLAVSKREIPLDEVFAGGGPRAERGRRPVEIPDLRSQPASEAQMAELHRAIEAALRRLPPEQRVVVLLRDVEGLDTGETAAALAISPPAVKMRLHRARARLRQDLGENFSLAK